jgi:transcriptional regulator with XRE-family HTH domain
MRCKSLATVRASLVNKIFGDRLSRIRRFRKVTQADLGRRIGVSRTTIANLESGEQNVQLHQVFAVANALEAPILEFLPEPIQVLAKDGDTRNHLELFLETARQQLSGLSGEDYENKKRD